MPTEFEGPELGHVLVFDFAGHYEYYASHAVLLESTSDTMPPLILVVVNLSKGDEEVRHLVSYWTSFVDSHRMSSSSKPHLAVVGSHKDMMKRQSGNYKAKISVIEDFVRKVVGQSSFHFTGFFAIDCRQPKKQKKLRQSMRESCFQLRSNVEIDSVCHVLGVFLLENFQMAATVQEVVERVDSSEVLLPCKVDRMCELCEELSNRMSILFLHNHADPNKSWIVLDIEALLSTINGRIFAPKEFTEHCLEPSSTGILSYSVIKKTFEDLDPALVIAFLSRLEFCRPISDPEILRLLCDGHARPLSSSGSEDSCESDFPVCSPSSRPTSSCITAFTADTSGQISPERDNIEPPPQPGQPFHPPSKPHIFYRNRQQSSASSASQYSENPAKQMPDQYLFFPELICAERPTDAVWQLSSEFVYHSGWYLECQQPQFFTPRFIQVLLLRIALGFATSKSLRSCSLVESQVFQRECTLWKSGVRWVNLDGIEAVVEVLDSGRAILLLMRGMEKSWIQFIKLRAQVWVQFSRIWFQWCFNWLKLLHLLYHV